MQTPKLFIIAIHGTHGTQEVRTSADGLYSKYSARKDVNREVEIVFLSRAGVVCAQMGSETKVTIKEGDIVGVYLVAHSGDMSTAVHQHDLAVGIKAVLDKSANGCRYKLDKVCLLVCTAAEKPPEMNHLMNESGESTLIQLFAKQLIGAGLTPRLAGWTGFVTVAADGRKQILSSTNLKLGNASDMNISRAKQKMCYVYDNDIGYVRKELSTWTDRK